MSRSNENIFFSPISISNAFAMLYAGTDGKTKKEIKQVFHFTPEKELHSYFSELIRKLKNVSGCELNIANALWVQKGYEFKKEFLNIAKKFYDGAVKELNFKTSPEESRKKINEWVEQKTKGKIKELIEKGSISSLTRLILTNAIYFNGEWCHQFNKKLTKEMPFYQINGNEKQVPMMQFEDFKEFNYFEDTIVQVLEMKYKGEKISMIIILQKIRMGLKMWKRF
jgi:serpin B